MPVAIKSPGRELIVILATSLVLIAGYMILQSTPVQDWWRGVNYQESSAIAAIRTELDLTGAGERVFLATQPSVEEAESFNEHCDSHEVEISLLGCYVDDRMYIYEITLAELKDSNKVTAAHELLHAIWERLGKSEREQVEQLLRQVEAENPEWVEAELALYDEDERMEELYTRVGTKLRQIPAELEQHYQQYFRNRSKIVDFYESYQAPFDELQAECEALRLRIEQLNQEINSERNEYLERLQKFDTRVAEFNLCADTWGCFHSQTDFQNQRNELEAERVTLNQLREDLNAKIDENNAAVADYQEKQQSLGKLNDALNSNIEKLERSTNE